MSWDDHDQTWEKSVGFVFVICIADYL